MEQQQNQRPAPAGNFTKARSFRSWNNNKTNAPPPPAAPA